MMKTIKLKNFEIAKLAHDLAEIRERDTRISNDGKSIFGTNTSVLFTIIKNKKIIDAANEDYDEAKNSIIESFRNSGKTVKRNRIDAAGNNVKDEAGEDIIDEIIGTEYINEWIEANSKLDATEVEITIRPIKFDEINGCELLFEEVEALEPFVIDEDENVSSVEDTTVVE